MKANRKKAKSAKKPGVKKTTKHTSENFSKGPLVEEPYTDAYRRKPTTKTFTIKRRGTRITFNTRKGYGYFITRLKDADNSLQLRDMISTGFSRADVEPVRAFLQLPQTKVAEAAAVSESTVSRWHDDSIIGRPGSEVFFKMDELIREGVELFESEEAFYQWVNQPNMALGNKKPIDLMTDQVGISMVEEAIDALHFGTLL